MVLFYFDSNTHPLYAKIKEKRRCEYLKKGVIKLFIDFGVGNSKKVTEEINGGLKGMSKKLDEIKQKWQKSFDVSPVRSVKEVKSELSKVNSEIEKTNKKIEENNTKQKALVEKTKQLKSQISEATAQADKYGQSWINGEAGADKIQQDWIEKANALKAELREVEKALSPLNTEAEQLFEALDKSEKEASELKEELGKAQENEKKLSSGAKNAQGRFNGLEKSVSRFGTRLKSIVAGAFIFNILSAGLRTLTQYLGNALTANNSFASSLSQIKGNLMTAFQPIYNAILPALTSLMNGLAKATAYAGAFISSLFGTSYKQSQSQAKALNSSIASSSGSGKSEQEKQIDKEIKAIDKKIKALQKQNKEIEKTEKAQKKANKENEKSVADFDELNILSENKAEEENPQIEANNNEIEALQEQIDLLQEKKSAIAEMNTGGSGSSGGIAPSFTTEVDTSGIDSFFEKMSKKFPHLSSAIKDFKGAWGNLTKSISDFWNNSGIKDVLAWLGNKLAIEGVNLLTGSIKFLSGAVNIASGLLKIFKGIFTGDWKTILEGGKQVLEGLGEAIEGVFVIILGQEAVDNIKSFVKEWSTRISQWWKDDVSPWFTKDRWIKLWEDVKQWFSDGWQDICTWWEQQAISQWFKSDGAIGKWFQSETWSGLWANVKQWFIDGWQGVCNWWNGDDGIGKWWKDSVKQWFTWKKWSGIFADLKDNFATGFKNAFNGVITIVEKALNRIIEKINSLSWAMPEWLGGQTFGFNFSYVKIPRLAQGTVVPPNRKFLAMLGDNTKEHEIVSPVSTMKQAFKEALQELGGVRNNGDAVFYLNGREFARATYGDYEYERKRKGTKLVTGGAH